VRSCLSVASAPLALSFDQDAPNFVASYLRVTGLRP